MLNTTFKFFILPLLSLAAASLPVYFYFKYLLASSCSIKRVIQNFTISLLMALLVVLTSVGFSEAMFTQGGPKPTGCLWLIFVYYAWISLSLQFIVNLSHCPAEVKKHKVFLPLISVSALVCLAPVLVVVYSFISSLF